jgi:hypothetical protein
MFRITKATCNAFTLAEVLILAAINLESSRLKFEHRVPVQSKNARHFHQASVRNPEQS